MYSMLNNPETLVAEYLSINVYNVKQSMLCSTEAVNWLSSILNILLALIGIIEYTLFFYKNLFYKNMRLKIAKKLRTS